MTYQPEPIDTSEIILNKKHLKLTELLAKNTHELWSQQRIAEGWQYGEKRDDPKKEHPCLIPYEDLPESEKHYDRVTSLGVIKTLLALGYRIEGQDSVVATHGDEERNLVLMLQSLKHSSELNLASLLALQRETINIKPRTPDIHCVIGDQILKLGEPLLAYDVLADGLKQWPHDISLQQKLALALARSGATQRANALLVQLLESGHEDEETLGLLARTHKDLWTETLEPQAKQHQLSLAAQRYEQAYQLSGGSPWTGINAATMAMLRGMETKAQTIANQVRVKCLEELQPSRPRNSDDYWTLATLGEAALILRQWSEAEDWYGKAVEVGQGRFGDLSSSRRNATLLVQHLGEPVSRVKQWFKIPRVAVFSGHVIDQPGRDTPRFPAHIEARVYRAIVERLAQLDALLGYASGAYGSDILFLEALLELKGEAHVVLPYEREEFIKNAVDIIPGGNWLQRFERVLSQASEVIVASKRKLEESDVVYEYANRLLHGLAKMRAAQLDTDLLPLAVWDGQPSTSMGGTASAVADWKKWGYEVEIIDLRTILEQEGINSVEEVNFDYNSPQITLQKQPEPLAPGFSRQIMALLFADVVKYSQLREEQISPFVQHFLGAVAALEARSSEAPVMKNTWGDALYFVFPNVHMAGRFALELCDVVLGTEWSTKGLPEDLNLRIALHAGPVYRYTNPITKYTSYIGTHVSHAARIEPITPPGKVYASQAFAALAYSEGVTDFSCDYVGQTPLAKGYGTFPTYHVRRCQLIGD